MDRSGVVRGMKIIEIDDDQLVELNDPTRMSFQDLLQLMRDEYKSALLNRGRSEPLTVWLRHGQLRWVR